MNRAKPDVVPPNIDPTKSNSNNPIRPQLIAPIITRANAIRRIVFIQYTPFIFNQTFLKSKAKITIDSILFFEEIWGLYL